MPLKVKRNSPLLRGKKMRQNTGAKIAAAKAPKALEEDFQKSAVDYLDRALPSHAICTAFPAGGGGVIRGKKLKAMGLKPGWPDIQILTRASSFDSIRSFSRFIGFECKREGAGIVSADQISAHKRITMAGGVVYVVRTLDEIHHHLTQDEGLVLRAKPS